MANPSPPNRRTDNPKTRAEKNRAFRNWLRERKRLRAERRAQNISNGYLPASVEEATEEFVEIAPATPPFEPPFKCEQNKHDEGWRVLDANERVAGVASSRGKQRALRDELNRGDQS